MRRSRNVRLARGSAAASVATFVALVSHVTAGGAVPSWLGIAVPAILSLTVCTLLAGRRLSLPRLAIAVTLSQALFHLLFVLGAARSPGAETTLGHDHAAMMTAISVAVPTGAASPGPIMWGGHAVAALLTIAALHRGERALAAIARVTAELVAAVRRRLALAVGSQAARGPVRRTPPLPRILPVRTALVLHHVRRRGPPLTSAI
ncbi:hypothetical protein [Microbacterium gorillae]|uniref:hypothetical protein n=1 Tax=Microbacterium gorillae TaxID=1231063 RepID=UPI00058E486C|nr:hypothetical protein [Microbacterium gorillae]